MTRQEAESLQPGEVIEYGLSKRRYRVIRVVIVKGKPSGILAVPIANEAEVELPMDSVSMLNKVSK